MTDPNAFIRQQIGQYQISSHIARGGMADVYLAVDVDLQRQAVLKIMLSNFAQDDAFVERFRREAQAMAMLHHPNVVQVYAIGITTSGQPYIAMQYVAEGTLAEKLAELGQESQILTTPFALALARQVADALEAAHRKGIVHRDLKPSNILLEANGKPLLTDLGIAVMESNPRLTQTNVLLGTPHYMSPEQIRGEPVDGRSDLYSLGIILYELFAGARPFTADVQWGVLHKQLYEKAPPLAQIRPDLPAEVVAIVAKCMEKLPEDRYQTAEELVMALDQSLAVVGAPGQLAISGTWTWRPADTGHYATGRSIIVQPPPPTVTPEPAAETVVSGSGRRRWPYALLLLLLLPVCVLGGWQVWSRLQSATPVPPPVETVAQVVPVAASTNTAVPTDTAVPATATTTPSPSPSPVMGEIALMRPESNVTHALADEVSFVWRWPQTLASEQFFTLYFELEGEEMRAMSIDAPSSGTLYRLQFVLQDIIEAPGRYRWYIRLEANGAGEPLQESGQRVLIIEAQATAEPTEETATPTLQATATASATARASGTPTQRATNAPTAPPTNTAAPPPPQNPTNTPAPPPTVLPTVPPPTVPPPTAPPPTAPPPTPPPTVPPP